MSTPDAERSGRTFSQVAYIVAEGLLYLVFGTGLIVLVSRLRGPEYLGQYVVMLTWVTITLGLASAGIGEIVLREIGRAREARSALLLHGLLITTGMAAAAAALMVGAVHVLDYAESTTRAITIASLIIFPGSALVAFRSGFVSEQLSNVVFRITCIELVLVQGANAWFVFRGAGVETLAITMVSGRALSCGLALYWSIAHDLAPRGPLSRTHFRTLAGPLATFTLIRLLGLLFWRLDILMLSRLSTMAVTGTYATATKFLEILSVLPAAYSQVTLGRRTRDFQVDGRPDADHLQTTVGWLFALLAPALAAVAVFSEFIIRVLFGTEFDLAIPVLRILMVVLAVLTLDLIAGMLCRAANRQGTDLKILGVMAAANVALNYLLIPPWQEIGAAIATLGSACLSFTLHAVYVHRRLGGMGWLRSTIAPGLAAILAAASIHPLIADWHPLVLAPAFGVVYVGALVLLARPLRFRMPPLPNRSR